MKAHDMAPVAWDAIVASALEGNQLVRVAQIVKWDE